MIYNPCDYQNLRISLTDPGLTAGWFWLQNIAAPDTVQYKPFSAKVSQSFGGQTVHGYKNVTLVWQNVDQKTAFYVKKYVDDALNGTGFLYLTVPANDGSKLDGLIKRWIDVRVIPYPIELEEVNNFAGGVGIAYRTMTLYGNSLTVINDPATGL